MKVIQEKLPASQVRLDIEISPEMSTQAYEKTLKEFMRNINIPGFRKGKVPRQILIQRLGPTRIKAAVLEELVEDGLKKALEQESVDAIGKFELRSPFEELIGAFRPGEAFTFSAVVDVPPEVEVKQYIDLTIPAEEVVYSPQQVEDVLKEYQQKTATLVPVDDRPAEMGDVALVDFEGRLAEPDESGEVIPIPGGSATDFQIDLEEGRFIEGFIEGVVGMTPGESKAVEATFPEAYPQEDVAGKPAIFDITLKEIKVRELPELDDDFAQDISEFETLAELRESLEKRYREEAEEKTKTNTHEAISQEMLQQVEVALPETLIKQEVDYMVTQTAMRLEQQGLDIKQLLTQELVEGMRERSRPDAITRLKQTLALGEIAKRESLVVEPEELEQKVDEFIDRYEDKSIDRDRVREFLKDDLVQDKVLSWLAEHNTIELVPEGTLSEAEDESPTEDVADGAGEAGESAAVDTSADSNPSAEVSDAEAMVVEVSASEVPGDEAASEDTSGAAETTKAEAAENVEPAEENSVDDRRNT
ncbi:MAG: trigger factor [Elainellaceae cyanobacterium]